MFSQAETTVLGWELDRDWHVCGGTELVRSPTAHILLAAQHWVELPQN